MLGVGVLGYPFPLDSFFFGPQTTEFDVVVGLCVPPQLPEHLFAPLFLLLRMKFPVAVLAKTPIFGEGVWHLCEANPTHATDSILIFFHLPNS